MPFSEPDHPFDHHPSSTSYPASASDPGDHPPSNPLHSTSSEQPPSASSLPSSNTPLHSWGVDTVATAMSGQAHDRGDSPMPDAQPETTTTTIDTVIAPTHSSRPSSSDSSFNSADSGIDDEDEVEHDRMMQASRHEDHDMADAPPPPPPPPPDGHPSASVPTPLQTDSRGADESHDRNGWDAHSQTSVDRHPWIPIYEDNSQPGEDELKRLETAGEVSAFDHEHWQKKAFKDVHDPEYKPVDSGRIEWTVHGYNGTQEHPNRELLLRSDPVMIGGHAWRIKLYPKGNGTSYLGAYIECDTFTPNPSATQSKLDEQADLDTPLPLLDGSRMKRPHQVPAQIMLLMYNPQEPRVNFQKKSSHSFAEGDPDRGFSRFGPTPYYDLGRRLPETRQAMLQNDSLAFIAHIRVFSESTGFLFARDDHDYRQDFALTGLRPVKAVTDGRGYATNLTCAVLTFALIPQIRRILYQPLHVDRDSKPLIWALRSMLCDLRRRPSGDSATTSFLPVCLDRVADAVHWYGVKPKAARTSQHLNSSNALAEFVTYWHPEGRAMQDFDVMQIWEYLLGILEQELEGTPYKGIAKALFGANGFRAKVPNEASSIRQSLREAVSRNGEQTLPDILQVELLRQNYVENDKKWKKIDGRIPLEDTITLTEGREGSYTLYGLVLHQGGLFSRQYTSILRPDGKNWYKFSTDRSLRVLRLTKKQALLDNEASSHIAIYMRCDVADVHMNADSDHFLGYPEQNWVVPQQLLQDVEKRDDSQGRSHDTVTPVPGLGEGSAIVKIVDTNGGQHTVEVRRTDNSNTPFHAVVIPNQMAGSEARAARQEEAEVNSRAQSTPSPTDEADDIFNAPPNGIIYEVDFFGSGYYKGTMYKGYRHGIGRRIYLDGNCFEGQFRKDLRHGTGKQVFQNGDTYEGSWVRDEMHGQGVFVSKSTGNVYRGGYKKGKQHGQFTLTGMRAEAQKGCLICYERDRDAVFYPCGHMCACMECARELEDCPYCHKQVAEPIRLYLT